MAFCERLPEQHADRPDVALRSRLLPSETFRSDIGERPGYVSDRRERVGTVELCETEVEEPYRDLVAVLEQDVGWLDVAMDDSGAVRMREGVEHLRSDLDGVCFRQRTRSESLSNRAARDVLVRDVDVACVMAYVVRPHAAIVPEAARGKSLALGPCSRFPFSRDDLERDIQTVAFVEREPDRAGAATPERAHRAVTAENELLG